MLGGAGGDGFPFSSTGTNFGSHTYMQHFVEPLWVKQMTLWWVVPILVLVLSGLVRYSFSLRTTVSSASTWQWLNTKLSR